MSKPTTSSPPSSAAHPHHRLLSLTCCMAGVAICYSAQVNLGTSELLLLGVPEHFISLAWLAGPLSGLIVQPIVGYFSDSCTSSFGRRRPFLLVGSLLTAFSLILFSNARLLPASLPLALVSFFLLDFCIQAVQGPLRALVTDVVPSSQRHIANAYLAMFTGIGNLIASALTAAGLKDHFPFIKTDAQAVFAIASIVLVTTVMLCIITIKETPASYSPLEGDQHLSTTPSIAQSNWKILKQIPYPYWRVYCIQFFTWCAFFAQGVYANTWVGTNIYLGDGTKPVTTIPRQKFEAGVRLGGAGNALTSLVTLLYALLLPYLLRKMGTVSVYCFSQLAQATSLLLTPFIRGPVNKGSKLAVLLDLALFGIPWATTMTVPWTLIADALDGSEWYGDRVGLFQMLFNSSQSGPQLVVALIAPAVLKTFRNDPSSVMFVGGVCAFFGAVFVVVLLRKDKRIQVQVDEEE